MESLNKITDKISNFYQDNKAVSNVLLIGSLLYFGNNVYKKWKYKQRIFTSKSEINDKVILITGCGHGFGNKLALTLSIDYGYRVIATCRTQKSVNEFLSNSSFKSNKSTAIIMDVTNDDDIEKAKEFVINYLNDTNSILWGVVNNAGLLIGGDFELIPPKFDKLQRDVLLNGPINITRTFLPLLPGRKNYKPNDRNNKLEYKSDGGRIINVSSITARANMSNCRYGVSKCALSYFSHALRKEISPRFGIWCTVVEPGGYKTNIINTMINKWSVSVVEELKQNGNEELIDIYQYDLDKINKKIEANIDKYFDANYDDVINDIVHGLTAKYPKREYVPGTMLILSMLEYAPHSVLDRLMLNQRKQMTE